MNRKEVRRERVSGGKGWVDAGHPMNGISREYERREGQTKIRKLLLEKVWSPMLLGNFSYVQGIRMLIQATTSWGTCVARGLAWEAWLENERKTLME